MISLLVLKGGRSLAKGFFSSNVCGEFLVFVSIAAVENG